MTEVQEPSKTSGIKITLAVVPALLIVSIIVALYLGANEEQEKQKPIQGEVTVAELSDYLEKLNHGIIERSFGSDRGLSGLKQSWSMIQGTLEPPNLGYEVFRKAEDSSAGILWPTLWINVGAEEAKEVTVLAVPYGVSGTPIAFALGLAEYYTMHASKKGIRIVFYPPLMAGDSREWIWDRVSGEDETLKGFVMLHGNGASSQWAELEGPESSGDFLDQLVTKKGWLGNLSRKETQTGEIQVHLGEQGKVPVALHGERLLRMMPVMKAILQEAGN